MITGKEPAFARSGVYCPPVQMHDEFIPPAEGMTIYQKLCETFIAAYIARGFDGEDAVNDGIWVANRTLAVWNS